MASKLKHIKVLTDPESGKERYQVRVYYRREFIASGVFDTAALARTFYKRTYEAAVRGEAKPAKARRQQRQMESKLDQPMNAWAETFVKLNPSHITKGRLNDYILIGRLLGSRKLRDFQGKAGGQLIQELREEWKFTHFRRGIGSVLEYKPEKEVSSQTLRLRLSALDVLIEFASRELPDGVDWKDPVMPFGYTKPPAHSNPRTRLPSNDEFMKLLVYFGEESDMGEFLQVVDETGCRASEILNTCGNDITLFGGNGAVTGGVLTLLYHKTQRYIGKRDVPLAQHAAEILGRRKETYENGSLFPNLVSIYSVCDDLDAAYTKLGISGLQLKDFRRAFITRSTSTLSDLERAKIIGPSALRGLKRLDNASETVKTAVGHSRVTTTLSYVVSEEEKMANQLTSASRWPEISAMLPTAAITSTVIPPTELDRTVAADAKSVPIDAYGTSERASSGAPADFDEKGRIAQLAATDGTTRCPATDDFNSTENASTWAETAAIRGATQEARP